MSLVSMLKRPGPSGFGYATTAEEATAGIDLSGKTVLLTGCSSGIGRETLRVLGLRGAHVIAAARTESKAQRALAETQALGTPLACELAEPASVHAAVAKVRQLGRPLHAIICNAGIMALPKLKQSHGYELQFFTNHIGHFILVTGLLDALAPDGRVVMVSSGAHKGAPRGGIEFDNLSGARGYSAFRAYGQSKLANLLFARRLAKLFAGSGKTAYALHPGVIATNLGRHMNPLATAAMGLAKPLFLKTVEQGAATQCYLAAQRLDPAWSGQYFADCNPSQPSAYGRDDALAEKLWRTSEEIVAGLSLTATTPHPEHAPTPGVG